MFARAKFFSSLLKNIGVVPDGVDTVRFKNSACSGTILLRNLVNNKTVLTSDTKKFLKKLRERGDVPEAKIFTPKMIISKNIAFQFLFSFCCRSYLSP